MNDDRFLYDNKLSWSAGHATILIHRILKNEKKCSWLWKLEIYTDSSYTCIQSFIKVFNSLVDDKLSQINCNACLSLTMFFSLAKKLSINKIKN